MSNLNSFQPNLPKDEPLRVLQVVLNLQIGGAQTMLRTLVEYLALNNCRPVVCALSDGPLRQEIERLGIKVEVLGLSRRHSIINFPRFIADMLYIARFLMRLIKEYDIQIVQTHLLRTLDFLVLFLSYITRARVVLWTVHSANFLLVQDHLKEHKWLLRPKRYLHRLLYRLSARLVNGFIAVSEQVKQATLAKIGPIGDKIFVVCNGVDIGRYGQPVNKTLIRRQLGLETDAYLIALVGTLRPVKGHRFLVEAMAALTPRYPRIHALFIGDGELRANLQAQAQQLGLTQNIHFLGNRSDVPNLLAASDLFVQPSLWEGLSMALLEAMATGLPIVASEVSGAVQVLTPNESGLLVPPDDVSRLTQAIEQLLTHPTRAQAMGAAARQRVEAHFSAQKQAMDYIALYRQLLP